MPCQGNPRLISGPALGALIFYYNTEPPAGWNLLSLIGAKAGLIRE
jgi:hypothetical protein